jgi:hypothetical protein
MLRTGQRERERVYTIDANKTCHFQAFGAEILYA